MGAKHQKKMCASLLKITLQTLSRIRPAVSATPSFSRVLETAAFFLSGFRSVSISGLPSSPGLQPFLV